jgi:hypothetical protein
VFPGFPPELPCAISIVIRLVYHPPPGHAIYNLDKRIGCRLKGGMQKTIPGILLSLFMLAGLSAARQVSAIDQDYSSVYNYDPETGQYTRDGPQSGGQSARGRDTVLPLSTMLGGALLVPGLLGAAYWKIQEKRTGAAG